MRSVIRLAGGALLVAAAVAAGYDGLTSLNSGEMRMAKVGDAWSAVHQTSLLLLQPAIERHLEPLIGQWVWDPVMLSILTAPVWVVLGLAGAGLMLLGRTRKSKAADACG